MTTTIVKKRSNLLLYIIIAIALFALGLFLWDYFHTPNITPVTATVIPIQPVQEVKINDTTRAVKQEVLVTHDKGILSMLYDSITKLLAREAGLKNPTLIAQFDERLFQQNTNGRYRDSLSKMIDTILSLNQDRDSTRAMILRLKSLKVPYTITDNRWRYEVGTFDMNGNITSDSLAIISKPVVVFGEEGGLFKRPRLSLLIRNDNPFITTTNAKSYTYLPQKRVKLNLDGLILTDGKAGFLGLGIGVRKGPFGITVGYIKQIIP